jgi:Iodothyronine deiodinase
VDLHAIYDAHKDRANFLTVYIAEAHPEDEWQMDSNVEEKIVFKQPKLFAERREAARILVERLKYRVPVAVDGMDNRADAAFAAWPERIYIVGADGRVVYKGGMGPFEFDVKEAGQKLARMLPTRPAQAPPPRPGG